MKIKQSLLDIIRRFCKKSGISHTTICVFDKSNKIGAIQSISYPCSKRDYCHYTVSASRLRLDKNTVSDLFSRDFVNPHAMKCPVQIEIDDGYNIIKIVNAWLTSVSATYISNDYYIIDNAEFEAETIEAEPSYTFC